jgi:N-acetyl-D-muramate 6-phosphate phosphatase
MTGLAFDCVLFDLDGTLVDTAPDLIACLNSTLIAYGFAEVEYQAVKPFISYGALAMISHSIDSADDALKAQMLELMLASYEANIAKYSQFFAGIDQVLTRIESLGLKWGVVTNKRQRFTLPLMTALGLDQRAACIISGDTTAFSKPHPEPMFAACRQAAVEPSRCIYIGDAEHDITAGKQANMKTLAAVYGYLKADDQPQNWGADGLITDPRHLLTWIETSLCH